MAELLKFTALIAVPGDIGSGDAFSKELLEKFTESLKGAKVTRGFEGVRVGIVDSLKMEPDGLHAQMTINENAIFYYLNYRTGPIYAQPTGHVLENHYEGGTLVVDEMDTLSVGMTVDPTDQRITPIEPV